MLVSKLSQNSLDICGLLTGLELHCDGLVGAFHEESASFSQSGRCARRLQAIFQHVVCARGISGSYVPDELHGCGCAVGGMSRIEYSSAAAVRGGSKAVECVWVCEWYLS